VFALINRLQRARFDHQVRAILQTPPAALVPGHGVHLVSQLQHKDVLMYLLAAKSFLARIAAGRVTVLDDGSLTGDDSRLLQHHVPGLELHAIADFRSSRCPAGGTWERLLAIADFCSRKYVVQLDSDTLTVDAIPEVAAAIAGGTSFAIATWDKQELEPMTRRAADARRLNPPDATHVQVVAEKAFDAIDGASDLSYVRGCSGFSGFARGAVSREFIEGFSSQMARLIGTKWSEWGSEQVMSNVAVANSPRATVLPHPKYCDCEHIGAGTAFVHFIGSCRFTGDTYARMARQVIAALQAHRQA
jgi:hypothetical protein